MVSKSNVSYRSLLSAHHEHDALQMVVNIHSFSIVRTNDIEAIPQDARRLSDESKRACDDVFDSFPIFATIFTPDRHVKVSLIHLNYNQSVTKSVLHGSLHPRREEIYPQLQRDRHEIRRTRNIRYALSMEHSDSV